MHRRGEVLYSGWHLELSSIPSRQECIQQDLNIIYFHGKAYKDKAVGIWEYIIIYRGYNTCTIYDMSLCDWMIFMI